MQKSRKLGFLAVVLALTMVLSPMAFAKTTSEVKPAKIQKSYSMTLTSCAAPFSLGYGSSDGLFSATSPNAVMASYQDFAAGDDFTKGTYKLFRARNDTQITAHWDSYYPMICFTAPEAGTYTFSPTFHTWEDNNCFICSYHVEGDKWGADSNAAGGMTPNVNRTLTTSNVSMAKGDKFLILIRCGWGDGARTGIASQLSLDSYTVTGDLQLAVAEKYTEVTYDLSDYGTTLDFGALTLGYGEGSGAYNYSHNFVPFTGYTSDGTFTAVSGAAGDSYRHFWKNGSDLCFRIQEGAGDGIRFVAPEDGTYSYRIKAHLQNGDVNEGEIGINFIPKTGSEDWFPGLFLSKDLSSTEKTGIELKKGDAINFVIRSIDNLFTEDGVLDEFVVTGQVAYTEQGEQGEQGDDSGEDQPTKPDKPVVKVETEDYDLLETYGTTVDNAPFVLGYGSGSEAMAAIKNFKAFNKIGNAFSRNAGKEYQVEGESGKYHFRKMAENGAAILYADPGYCNIISFTAPRDGAYTVDASVHNWWNTDIVIDCNVDADNNGWLDMTRIGKETPTAVLPTAPIGLKKGQTLYFVFRYTYSSGYDAATINKFVIHAEFKKVTKKETATYNLADSFATTVENTPFVLGYGNNGNALEAIQGFKAFDKIGNAFNRNAGKEYQIEGESGKFHFRRMAETQAPIVYGDPGYCNIISFTAPKAGTYTLDAQVHTWWAADIVIDCNIGGTNDGWQEMTRIQPESPTTVLPAEGFRLKKGETIYFVFRYCNENSYDVVTIDRFVIKAEFGSAGTGSATPLVCMGAAAALVTCAVIVKKKKKEF